MPIRTALAVCASGMVCAVAGHAAEGGVSGATTALTAAATGDARLLAAADGDHDGRISQVEALVLLYGSQQLARRRAPAAFAMLDGDGDGLISRAEAARAAPPAGDQGFTVAERRRRVSDRMPGGTGGGLAVGGAYAFFGEQQAYIRDYDVSGGTYDPVIGILGTGTVIAVSDIVITIRRTVRR